MSSLFVRRQNLFFGTASSHPAGPSQRRESIIAIPRRRRRRRYRCRRRRRRRPRSLLPRIITIRSADCHDVMSRCPPTGFTISICFLRVPGRRHTRSIHARPTRSSPSAGCSPHPPKNKGGSKGPKGAVGRRTRFALCGAGAEAGGSAIRAKVRAEWPASAATSALPPPRALCRAAAPLPLSLSLSLHAQVSKCHGLHAWSARLTGSGRRYSTPACPPACPPARCDSHRPHCHPVLSCYSLAPRRERPGGCRRRRCAPLACSSGRGPCGMRQGHGRPALAAALPDRRPALSRAAPQAQSRVSSLSCRIVAHVPPTRRRRPAGDRDGEIVTFKSIHTLLTPLTHPFPHLPPHSRARIACSALGFSRLLARSGGSECAAG